MSDFSKEYAESLQQAIGNIVLISDKDEFISVCGISKKEYLDKKISPELEKVLEDRKTLCITNQEEFLPLCIDENLENKYSSQIISPIVAEGDTIGSVIILSKEGDDKLGIVEQKLAETVASFLGKQME